MGRKLVLIKHSHPQIEPDVTAANWRLSDFGRERCTALAERLCSYEINTLIASPEPKAIETAELVGQQLGLRVQVVDGLQEHDRSNTPFYDSHSDFEAAVQRLFERPDELVMGRETATQACTRFASALDRVIASYPHSNIAVVTHGTVMSLYVGHAAKVDTFDLWRGLGLPSFVVLSLPDLRLVETVGSV